MPASLTRRCQEGENSGKPGPCPLARSAPSAQKQQPRATSAWTSLVSKGGGLVAGAKIAAARMGQAAWDRLPKKAQRGLARTWAAARAVEHVAMAGFHKVSEMVEATARERGYSAETAHRVARVLGTVDAIGAWTVNPAIGYAVGGAIGAKAAAWTPVFGLAFLTASTATRPIATYRAAKKVLSRQQPITRKSRSMGPDVAALCLEHLSGPDAEWREALLYAALDTTRGDIEKALELVDATAAGEPGETRKSTTPSPAPSPAKRSADSDLGDDMERVELMADILGGLFGDKALLAFEDMDSGHTEKSYGIHWLTMKAWEELDHPRGKNGRFIKKGSAEAVAAATVAIRSALRAKPESLAPEHAKKLAEHLSILTVKQLRQLKKEHGLRANGRIREQLVNALVEHLPGVKDRIDKLKEEAKAKGKERGGEAETGAGSGRRGDASAGTEAPAIGGGVEGEAARPGDTRDGQERPAANQPDDSKAAARVPASRDEVMKRLDRYQNLFRSRGNHQAAEFLDALRNHVNAVGTDAALESLGTEGGKGDNEGTTYEGEKAGWEDMSSFGKAYLDRYGITSVHDTGIGNGRVVSSLSQAFGGEGGKGHKGDFQPTDPTLKDKLEESKKLPGLETSEDLGVIVGKPVTHLTQEVLDKMDERYGKGQWIIKTYGDYAFAGNGIFFPQRAEQIRRDARANLWDAGSHLVHYGFAHLRDESGKVVGIKHQGGDEYRFGTEKYDHTIHGDARHWGDVSAAAAANEQGAELPFEGKDFMAQPAFPVVGISNEERAQGITFKRGQEGRTHIVTRNGKAELIPHTTWLKMEPMPVVFEDDDTQAMAQAAVDAINALPESERQGQVYAPDIVRTADGYRVVEANPSNYSGPSGYLGDNPFIIDSYVSHLTGREPAHVSFIRKLLTKKGEKSVGANAAAKDRQSGAEGGTSRRPEVPEHDARGKAEQHKAQRDEPAKSDAEIRQGLKSKRAAQEELMHAQENVGRYGFDLLYNDAGKVAGIAHENGDEYLFGSPKYEHTIHGDVRHWSDRAAKAAQTAHAPIVRGGSGEEADLERNRHSPEGAMQLLRDSGAGEMTDSGGKESHHRDVLAAAKKSGFYVPPEKVPALRRDLENIGGYEHDVYLDPDTNRVWKLTANGKFGHGDRGVHDYLRRLEEANRLWPALGYRINGVTEDHADRPQLITSMNHIAGDHPPDREVAGWFRQHGWQPIGWDGAPGSDEHVRSWRDPHSGTIIGDTHGGNFIRTAEGLVPIDVDIIPGHRGK